MPVYFPSVLSKNTDILSKPGKSNKCEVMKSGEPTFCFLKNSLSQHVPDARAGFLDQRPAETLRSVIYQGFVNGCLTWREIKENHDSLRQPYDASLGTKVGF